MKHAFLLCLTLLVGCSPADATPRGCRSNAACYLNEHCTAGCVCAAATSSSPSECPSAIDAGSWRDAGIDAGEADADAGEADAGEADAGEADAGEADAGEADAGEADAGEADAGEADAGVRDGGSIETCNAALCPQGCCRAGRCEAPGANTCGSQGSACVACGAGEVCSSGSCRCGSGAPCAQGQRCNGGQCVCDSMSCRGCCRNNACEPGTADTACGGSGYSCVNCTTRLDADRCIQGRACGCGQAETPSVCGPGYSCFYGGCTGCDVPNCLDGCCDSSTCVRKANYSDARCGRTALPGASCIRCSYGSSCDRAAGDCRWPDGGLAPPAINGGALFRDGGSLCGSCDAGCCELSSVGLLCTVVGDHCQSGGTCSSDGICR